MTTPSDCCEALGGEGMEDTPLGAVCKNAILLGRPYDIMGPCAYVSEFDEARASYKFGTSVFDIAYFLGGVSAFLIPSTSAYNPVDSENAPLSSQYAKTVTATADQGLKVLGILVVIVGFLVYKYTKK